MFSSFTLGVRLYHTVTPLPRGGGAVVYGGRSSPLRPNSDLFKLTFDLSAAKAPCPEAEKVQVEPMDCTGNPPPPRFRHTATVVRHKGEPRPNQRSINFDPQSVGVDPQSSRTNWTSLDDLKTFHFSSHSNVFLSQAQSLFPFHVRQTLPVCVWWKEPISLCSG